MSDDYFALLGLGNASFSIDLDLMEKNYLNIQRSSHPDRFFFIKDKESAVKHIEKVNRAYLVLKSPISRAEYMLDASGIKVSEEDRSKIVAEVFDLNLTGIEARQEVDECFKKVDAFFSDGDMYQAAIQVEKLKYLKGMERGKRACN